MATVRMKKGDKYADIFDSPETIKQAQLDGFSFVEAKKNEVKTEKPVVEEKKTVTESFDDEDDVPVKSGSKH